MGVLSPGPPGPHPSSQLPVADTPSPHAPLTEPLKKDRRRRRRKVHLGPSGIGGSYRLKVIRCAGGGLDPDDGPVPHLATRRALPGTFSFGRSQGPKPDRPCPLSESLRDSIQFPGEKMLWVPRPSSCTLGDLQWGGHEDRQESPVRRDSLLQRRPAASSLESRASNVH